MAALRSFLVLGWLLLWLAAPAQAQQFPPLSGRVVDVANLLDPAQEAQLTQLSEQIEQASTRQFVVATIPDLQGYPIEDYGYRLGREWGIGRKDANNGILLIVAPAERKVRIEVGYGLEPIMPDGLASTIVRDTILPRFRDGDMPGGILAGAQAIGEQMKLPLEAAEARAAAQVQAGDEGDGEGAIFLIFWGIVLAFMLLSMFRGRGGRGQRFRRGRGPVVIWGPGMGSSGWGGGSSWGGRSSGGFSGGGGSFGGGGASGGW